MRLNKDTFLDFAKNQNLSSNQIESIWEFFNEKKKSVLFSNIFYYLGGLILFIGLVWILSNSAFLYSKGILLLISFVAAAVLFLIGLMSLRKKKNLASITLSLSLLLVPLITYSLESLMGWWPGTAPGEYPNYGSLIEGGWVFMEITTIVATLTTLYFVRLPLLTFVLYLTLSFMSQDLTPLFLKSLLPNISNTESWIAIFFGLSLLANGFSLDRTDKTQFAFWAYFFGALSFFTGLLLFDCKTEYGYFICCSLSVLLFMASMILNRKALTVFAVLGILDYIRGLYWRHFSKSLSFPILLALIGLGVLGLGLLLQKKKLRKPKTP